MRKENTSGFGTLWVTYWILAIELKGLSQTQILLWEDLDNQNNDGFKSFLVDGGERIQCLSSTFWVEIQEYK